MLTNKHGGRPDSIDTMERLNLDGVNISTSEPVGVSRIEERGVRSAEQEMQASVAVFDKSLMVSVASLAAYAVSEIVSKTGLADERFNDTGEDILLKVGGVGVALLAISGLRALSKMDKVDELKEKRDKGRCAELHI